MEVVCKEKFNTIFWRHDPNKEWNQAYIDDVIEAYEDSLATTLDFAWTVKNATGDIIYYVYFCHNCGKVVVSEDPNPGFEYCPHCGRKLED